MNTDQIILALLYHLKNMLRQVEDTTDPATLEPETLFDVIDAQRFASYVTDQQDSQYSAT